MKIIFYTISTLFLFGCGGSNSSSTDTVQIIGSEASGSMTINKLYIMHPGDIVKKVSDNAKIQVLHTDKNIDSSIKLLVGKAAITRAK